MVAEKTVEFKFESRGRFQWFLSVITYNYITCRNLQLTNICLACNCVTILEPEVLGAELCVHPWKWGWAQGVKKKKKKPIQILFGSTSITDLSLTNFNKSRLMQIYRFKYIGSNIQKHSSLVARFAPRWSV